MKVSVIIPNLNGLKLLKKNLRSIIKSVSSHEVIIVDDGSTDGSVSFIKTNFPKVKLIEKITTDGFSTSVNLGVKAAEGNIVVLLNTDVIPRKNFLQSTLKHFLNDKVFAVGFLDYSIEGDQIIKRGRGIGKFTRGFLIHSRGEINAVNTLWVSGGSGAFRKIIWEKLGGMDELYNPFYWEDIDLSYRAQKSGYSVVFEAKSQVEHLHDEGSIKAQYSHAKIKSISYRNQFIFVWKNITDTNLLSLHFIWLPYHLLKAFINFDLLFWQGFFTALRVLPKIAKKRAWQSTHIKKSDWQVLNQFLNEYKS